MIGYPPRDGAYAPRDDQRTGRSEPTRGINDITPIHTVFIRNLSPRVTDEELARVTGEFGEVSSMFSLAVQRGFAFVTFYDLREAEKCVNGLEGRVIDGQTVHTSFAHSPSDNAKHDLLTCSTISAVAKEGTQLTNTDISAAFARYGDIKSIEGGETPNLFTVKYYDLRAAKRAVDDNGNVEIKGERVECVYNTKDDDDLKCIQRKEERREREKRERSMGRDDRRHDRRDGRYDYGPYPGYAPPPPMYGYPGYPPGQQGYVPYPPYAGGYGYPGAPPAYPGYPPYPAPPQAPSSGAVQQPPQSQQQPVSQAPQARMQPPSYQGYMGQQAPPPAVPPPPPAVPAPPPPPSQNSQGDMAAKREGDQELLKLLFS